jgi:hypothetical protein
MMLPQQNNFGYLLQYWPPAAESVGFASPNTAGNGLIVVAYFLIAIPGIAPNFEISDSAGNTYQSIGACGLYDGSLWTSLLQIWYVSSCRAGANTVTVRETTSTQSNTFILAVSVFEYSGGFGAVDGSSFARGLTQPSLTLSLTATAADDLLFGFAADFGQYATVALGSATGAYTTEQTEAIHRGVIPYDVMVATVGVDRIRSGAGIETVTFDFSQYAEELDTALLVALPCGLPAPSPTPPPPSPPPSPPWPPTPILGPGEEWPTIF